MKGVKRANLFAAGGPFSGDWWIGPLMVILFLAVWEIAPRLGLVNEFFTSRPSLLLQAAIVDYGSRDFWSDALVSLVEFGIGFGLALLFGIPLGLLMGSSRFLREFFTTPLMALYVTPTMVLLPLLIIWVGIGMASRASVALIAAIFPIIINIVAGIDQVEKRLLQMAKVFGASWLNILTQIYIPATLPFLLTGVRLAIGRAVLTVIAAEMFVSQAGMGFKITMYGDSMRIDMLLVYVLTVSMFGYLMTRLVVLLEAKVSTWKQIA